MKISEHPQGSEGWKMARAGVVTASEAGELLTPLFAPRTGDGPRKYLYRKAAERIFGMIVDERGGTWAMGQGQAKESMAVGWYSFTRNVDVQRVGLCLTDDLKCGASPDGLIGDDAGIEIKSPEITNHIRYLLEGRLPPEYAVQVHFSMYVTGRREWTFVSYHPHAPKLVVLVPRDEEIQAKIAATVGKFVSELDECERRIRAMMPQQQGRA